MNTDEQVFERGMVEMKATDKESLTVQLRAACVGHPSAEIPWPHRILHEAADQLEINEKSITMWKANFDFVQAKIAELEARCAKMRAWIAKSEHLSMCDAHPQAYDIQGKSITNPKCTCGKDALAEGGEHG